MTPRLRVGLVVAAAALAAAGVTVGVTLATRTTPRRPVAVPARPPLVLDLGVRTDPEAKALRHAAGLYAAKKREQAHAIFSRYHSLEAQVGAALTAPWPNGRVFLAALGRSHQESALARLYEGILLFEDGRAGAAKQAWRAAKRLRPDSAYAITASDLLHPELPVPGLPQFVPSFSPPPQLGRLTPPRQLAFLARRARAGGTRERLLYGVALQRLSRPVSAEREFAAAAARAPSDPEALTASAVGRFDKDAPSRAFAQLGPLAHRFPQSVTVRFHLGLLLLWLGRVGDARRQLTLARDAAPRSPLGIQAAEFLKSLRKVRTR